MRAATGSTLLRAFILLAASLLLAQASAGEASKPGHRRSAGDLFRDCRDCPAMVVIPGGKVVLGSDASRLADGRAQPQRTVSIRPFAASASEITFAQWDACARSGGCGGYRPNDHGWGRGSRPVIEVSWRDAQDYVDWLSRRAGRSYRLLSEAEWEYAAKAGAETAYWWGNRAERKYANYGAEKCCSGEAEGNDRWVNSAPVGSFPANRFGLHDMNGNVAEWVEDCAAPDYSHIPLDGSPNLGPPCVERVHRGGGWFNIPAHIRSDIRPGDVETSRTANLGFRVAVSLAR